MRGYIKFIKLGSAVFLTALVVGLLSVLGTYLFISPSLPSIEGLSDVKLQVPLRIYSQDGALIGEFGEKRRSPKELGEIPLQLRQAFLSAEDDRFYEHPGIDYQGILRAVGQLVKTGKRGQGGSTITMQLARNFYLSPEKTYVRKIKELFLSLKIESELEKDQILELYLNKIYLGNRAYGVAAAAQVYYGKQLADLDLAQIAMIAGLPKAPSRYNPIINPDRAVLRRNYVLKRMVKLGYIDEADMRWARVQPVTAGLHQSPIDVNAPYIAEMVRAELVEQYGNDAYTNGLKVITTVDSRLQTAANNALVTSLLDYDVRHGYRGVEAHFDITYQPEELVQPVIKEKRRGTSSLGGDIVRLPETEGLIDELMLGLGLVEKASVDMMLGKPEVKLWEQAYMQGQSEEWDKQLKPFIEENGLKAALVLEVNEKSAKVYLRGDRIIALDWAGIEWARPYETVNKQGVAPSRVSDVFVEGDIIRIRRDKEGHWQLSQIPEVEGSLLAINPNDGGIRALIGGFNFTRSSFNRVLQAKRQAGSSFKPFIYSAALEKDYTAASIINDAPVVFHDSALEGMWKPENYSGKFYGPTRFRKALMKSRNLVSIRVLRSIGVGYAARYAEKFGFDRNSLRKDLTLALGSCELTPLELGTGFSVIANGGYKVKPYFIKRIIDIDYRTVFEADPAVACVSCALTQQTSDQFIFQRSENAAELPVELKLDDEPEVMGRLPKQAEQTVEGRNIYLMNSILRDVVKKGTARRARVLGRNDLAGKTGTTNDQRDAWFNGFMPDLVATTWVGFDQVKSLGARETGSRAALPMWIDFMREALKGVPEKQLERPEGLLEVRINADTGELAAPGDPRAIFETFRSERAPKAGQVLPTVPAGDGEMPEHLF
ncbi:MAG: penicillin-binding protein 1A [Gammaproteobacteria bacterium]|nr:penicillin-binding protein 1A [Gammaproteobacteria bacterium]